MPKSIVTAITKQDINPAQEIQVGKSFFPSLSLMALILAME